LCVIENVIVCVCVCVCLCVCVCVCVCFLVVVRCVGSTPEQDLDLVCCRDPSIFCASWALADFDDEALAQRKWSQSTSAAASAALRSFPGGEQDAGWVFACVTWSRGDATLRMYSSGVEVASCTVRDFPLLDLQGNNHTTWSVGGMHCDGAFTGLMGELVVFDRALPSAEIARAYQQGMSGTDLDAAEDASASASAGAIGDDNERAGASGKGASVAAAAAAPGARAGAGAGMGAGAGAASHGSGGSKGLPAAQHLLAVSSSLRPRWKRMADVRSPERVMSSVRASCFPWPHLLHHSIPHLDSWSRNATGKRFFCVLIKGVKAHAHQQTAGSGGASATVHCARTPKRDVSAHAASTAFHGRPARGR
jgi:hypothetical protein